MVLLVGLLSVALGLCFVILVSSLLLVIQFGHPDDKNVALFPKFIVIVSIFLSCVIVLFLPFDVACAHALAYGVSVRTDLIWQILLAIAFVMITFVIPFAYFFYESDDDP